MKHTSLPNSVAVCGIVVAFLFLFVSCGSHRKVVSDGADGVVTVWDDDKTSGSVPTVAVVSLVNAHRQTATGLRAKMSMRLVAGQREVTVGGTLKMKRDEIIQLQLTALGLLEVGRLELTPDYLFVMDKINKQYVRIAWNEVPGLQTTGLGFSTFQALFWNELFVWGNQTMPVDGDFSVIQKKQEVILEPAHVTAEQRELALRFLVDAGEHLLQQTSVSAWRKSKLSFSCDYQNFALLADKQFPHQLSLTIAAATRTYRADISLSRLQVDESMGALATTVNSLSYRQVTFDEIMTMITKHTSR